MRALLAEVSRSHFPNPPATVEQIEAFEQGAGWKLDPDLRTFYLHCDGAALFDRLNPAFFFYPLSKIKRLRAILRREDSDESGPATWYAVCEVRDTNFIILDVSRQEEGRYPIRDGYSEGFPDPKWNRQIARSFAEFLDGALRSNGHWFWLKQFMS